MARGVAHSAELRAEVIAAVLAGLTIAQAARQYGLAKRTVANWVEQDQSVGTVGTEQRARDLGELILDLITAHVTTLQAQLQATARPEWIEKQPAAELAQLAGTYSATLLRLLAGLHPTDPNPPGLPPPADASSGPDADGD